MRKPGFTLIEVMVVLSMLAIIAILAYNFFGGTMQSAQQKARAVKIYNHVKLAFDGKEMYEMKVGDFNYACSAQKWTDFSGKLISNGIVRSFPNVEVSSMIPCNNGNYVGSATTDWTLWVRRVDGSLIDDATCKLYNETYTSYGPNILDMGATTPTGYPDDQVTLCVLYYGTNYVISIMDPDYP